MSTAYEIVTETIIKQLESGVAPWRKPWRTATPANMVSKKEYRGINVFLLASQGYGSRYWVTYRQAQTLPEESGIGFSLPTRRQHENVPSGVSVSRP